MNQKTWNKIRWADIALKNLEDGNMEIFVNNVLLLRTQLHMRKIPCADMPLTCWRHTSHSMTAHYDVKYLRLDV